jgi:hypothetical protein
LICAGCGVAHHPVLLGGDARVVSAECPCGERLFAWRQDDQLVFGGARAFLRRPSRARLVTSAEDVLLLAVFVAVGAVLAALALGEALRTIAFEAALVARLLLLGGPACVLLSLAYIAWCFAADALGRWLADRRLAYREPPAGLRLVREPETYRG